MCACGGGAPGAGDSRVRGGHRAGGDGEDRSGQRTLTQCLMAVAAEKTRGGKVKEKQGTLKPEG